MSDVPLGGLRVEQVAGVHAALQEKIPLDDVLSQEGIDKAQWASAEKAWREKIVPAPDLHLTYSQRLRVAEDALRRPCPPYDDDPAAWVALTAALAISDDVRGLVEKLGLALTDFGRLGRHWRRKLEKDPALADELDELAKRPGAPKAVKLEPVKLKPFPWTPGAAAPIHHVAAAAPVAIAPAVDAPLAGRSARLRERVGGRLPIEIDVDLYAALSVILELAPGARQRALELLGVQAPALEAILATWRERAAEPAFEADLSVRKLDHRVAVREIMRGARPTLP